MLLAPDEQKLRTWLFQGMAEKYRRGKSQRNMKDFRLNLLGQERRRGAREEEKRENKEIIWEPRDQETKRPKGS